jgi:hypothetical protein
VQVDRQGPAKDYQLGDQEHPGMVGNRFAGVGQEKGSGRRFAMSHGWHVTQKLVSYSTGRLHPIPGWCLRSRSARDAQRGESRKLYA